MQHFYEPNRLGRTVLALAVGALCFCGSAAAESAPDGFIKAREQLLNAHVVNHQGEELGEIEELVLNGDGAIQYVVISHGGVLDLGDKVVAVPWNQTRLAVDDDHVVMDLTRAELVKAPSFEKDQWPDMNSDTWKAQVRTYSDWYAAQHDESAPAVSAAGFDALDRNRDGHIDTKEAAASAPLRAQFEELDRNGDNSLSRWEFNAYEQPRTMAGNDAGVQSPTERIRDSLSPQQQQRREEIAASSNRQNVTKAADSESKSSKGGGNKGKSAQQSQESNVVAKADDARNGSGSSSELHFRELDTDTDGSLSRNEVKAEPHLAQRFAQVDKNNDGRIDHAEFSAFEEADAAEAAQAKEPTGDSRQGAASKP